MWVPITQHRRSPATRCSEPVRSRGWELSKPVSSAGAKADYGICLQTHPSQLTRKAGWRDLVGWLILVTCDLSFGGLQNPLFSLSNFIFVPYRSQKNIAHFHLNLIFSRVSYLGEVIIWWIWCVSKLKLKSLDGRSYLLNAPKSVGNAGTNIISSKCITEGLSFFSSGANNQKLTPSLSACRSRVGCFACGPLIHSFGLIWMKLHLYDRHLFL